MAPSPGVSLPKPEDPIGELLKSYNELNRSGVDELDEEPSPLEFMRYVARNRPFVARKCAADWKACVRWNADYLTNVVGAQLVNVAITPLGNADSPVESEDGSLVFVKPLELEEPFDDVLQYIQNQELQAREDHQEGKQENDNLRNEYEVLYADVPKDVAFARVALQRAPEAINFWLGNSKSTTALHKDNYENVYVQVLGQKHFVLLPPVAAACVNEQELQAATYGSSSGGPPDDAEELLVQADCPGGVVPFPTWDPDQPRMRSTRYSALCRPMRVTLNPGDMLYLPALWYHKVSQSCSDEGLCCAVNYWYDMNFDGSLYSMYGFGTSVARKELAAG
ncbi:putative pla2g4b [Lineolata rhizophorae]|uniref:Putative pla2g4b n=1 Tax=Lineolata rhizophorae TaxID=578093 RepID=A0A6A6PE35_9PEZI|nr:putative pla2g4b [Lineolata rhizophorae]